MSILKQFISLKQELLRLISEHINANEKTNVILQCTADSSQIIKGISDGTGQTMLITVHLKSLIFR